jgi:hypothetical protein
VPAGFKFIPPLSVRSGNIVIPVRFTDRFLIPVKLQFRLLADPPAVPILKVTGNQAYGIIVFLIDYAKVRLKAGLGIIGEIGISGYPIGDCVVQTLLDPVSVDAVVTEGGKFRLVIFSDREYRGVE